MREGVLVTDSQKRVVDANPAMQSLMMPFYDNIIGIKLRDIFHLINRSNVKIIRGNSLGAEICINDQEAQKHYAVTITPLLDKKKNLTGKVFVLKDITEQKQTQENLASLNQLKDKLFSIIAHDLRSPLVNLLDLLNMASEGDVSEEELRIFLPQLKKNVDYTSSLVENLLQWSKSQLKGEITKPVKLDLGEMTGFMVNSFSERAREKGITLENKLSGSVFAYADRDMIEAVYRNLLSNAIKFCRKGDLIQVSGKVSNDHTTLCVKDTGIGMSDSDVKRLFNIETFTRRGTLNEQGTGLGLLLVKDFIEKNNGKIWVQSTPGEGAQFYFSLPCVHPPFKN